MAPVRSTTTISTARDEQSPCRRSYRKHVPTYKVSSNGTDATLSDVDQDDDGASQILISSRHSQCGRDQKPDSRLMDPDLLAEQITIKGSTLRPTVVFDTFWYFAAERKAIDDRRRAGQPQPWTDDPILQKYAFCNTYRVLDRVSQFIITHVIQKGSQEPAEIVFRIILFNLFTKIETWKLLVDGLGPLTWARYNRNQYQKVLTRAKNDGMTLYTGAFQKPAPHFGYKDAFMNHLCLLEVIMENDLAGRLPAARYVDEVFEYLISFPGMGEFSTYQLILNLSYSSVLNFSEMDFVYPGPGASSGLSKMFGTSVKKAKAKHGLQIEIDIIRWLAEHQDEQFKRLGLEFSGLGPKRLPMGLADIEHLLSMRNTFTPSTVPYPEKPILPKAWSRASRKVVRVRPGRLPAIEKRYTVSRIGEHRQGANGPEYKVYWSGYADSEATWEPEETLKADAPVAVQEYWDSCGRRHF